jgi:hypothetical protein
MIAPAPIDPFLRELKHAQLAGQRVLAAQRRPSRPVGQPVHGEPHPRVAPMPARGLRLEASGG